MKSPALTRTIPEIREAVGKARQGGKTVGLVPTMGALHEGHASLIRAARVRTGFVVVTIFVNPTQFGPHEDLDRYPRQLAQDLEVCGQMGTDVVFAPLDSEIYAGSHRTYVEVHGMQNVLCGKSRPGHFRGVATVVLKLFNIIQPDVAFFGQKDGQQARLIEQLVADLNVPVEVVVCPTVREPDGLALSSRNKFLDAEQRRNAVVLHQALEEARALANKKGDATLIREAIRQRVNLVRGAELDYVEVVSLDTLEPVEKLSGRVMIALAVRFGSTRLIDNIQIDMPAYD